MKKAPKDTNRIAKVNSFIAHELGPILHQFSYDGPGFVTISKVETTKDMKEAKVWVSILTNDPIKQDPSGLGKTKTSTDEKILTHLRTHLYDIQGALNARFTTKIIPRIRFILDTAPRYVQHIDALIRTIHNEEELHHDDETNSEK